MLHGRGLLNAQVLTAHYNITDKRALRGPFCTTNSDVFQAYQAPEIPSYLALNINLSSGEVLWRSITRPVRLSLYSKGVICHRQLDPPRLQPWHKRKHSAAFTHISGIQRFREAYSSRYCRTERKPSFQLEKRWTSNANSNTT